MTHQLFARRTSRQNDSPGPGAYDTGSPLGSGVPKYSMKSRHSLTEKIEGAPYRVLPSTIGVGPKVSLSSRHATLSSADSVPGPSYVPPALGSDAKKISFSSRHSIPRGNDFTPGPGAYNIQPLFARDAKSSSMHIRSGNTSATTDSPGPGAYYPDINATKHRAPSSSFHIRPQDPKSTDVTPGPSDYNVARELGGTKPTFHARVPLRSSTDVTPGPGAYSPNPVFTRPPSYSLSSRHNDISTRPETAPYRVLPSTFGQGPKISMSSRHATKLSNTESPGPTYVPPSLGSDAPKISMTSRHAQVRGSQDTPGPGAYSIQSSIGSGKGPVFHARAGDPMHVNTDSPGPGAYLPDMNAVLRKAPAASMHVRTKLNEPESTPGYVDLGSTLNGRGFTIGRKEGLDIVPI